MITFPVSEEKNRQLRELMALVGLREEEIEEKFIRSSGKGGQHVNKTATCVYLRHLPSGLEVKCMKDRSQSLNRFLARRELAEKLALRSGISTARGKKGDKLRKQKARLKKRAAGKYGKNDLSTGESHKPEEDTL